MASWYSNLLTKTSSQISSIRQNLLSSESDGDTEDDTHVCRVLRAYYSEKGRPFPTWLPADPKAPVPVAAAPLYAPVSHGQQAAPGGRPALQSGLSSLWDTNAAGRGAQQAPASLRAGRGGVVGRQGSAPGVQRNNSAVSEEPQARPLPSQRAGSHQTVSSAQDRLKQRLWGGSSSRGASPQQATPFQPPSGGGNYGASYTNQGGNYEDRFAPGGSYDSRRGDAPPQMSANAPWSSGGDDRGGAGRRGPGLPSGPRGYR